MRSGLAGPAWLRWRPQQAGVTSAASQSADRSGSSGEQLQSHSHSRPSLGMAASNWIMMISEQHRYQGVSYKSDIIVISGTSGVALRSIST